MGEGRGPGRSRSRGGGGTAGVALREGAHGRQRGGNAAGGDGHRGLRERAPAGQRCRSAQPCSPGSCRRLIPVAVRVFGWRLKNAEREWNKTRSSIPCAAWVSCRGSALPGILHRAGPAVHGGSCWKTLEAVRLIQWIREAEEARCCRSLSHRHCSTMAALKN